MRTGRNPMSPSWSDLARRCLWLAYWWYRALRRSWRRWRVSRRPAPREWWDTPLGAPIRLRRELPPTFYPYAIGGGIDLATREHFTPEEVPHGSLGEWTGDRHRACMVALEQYRIAQDSKAITATSTITIVGRRHEPTYS